MRFLKEKIIYRLLWISLVTLVHLSIINKVSAQSLEFSELNDAHPLRLGNGIDFFTYKIVLSGEIEIGLLDNLQQVLKDKENKIDIGNTVLFLASEGGNFQEALKVADYISELGLTTAVGNNVICLSACGILFMSGRFPPYEGPGGISRYLHVGATLGFHAPYIRLPDSILDKPFNGTYRDVQEKFNIGIKQIGELLSGNASTGLKWPPSLLGEALLTPPGQFVYVDTIDDAGRWNINLFGFKNPTPLPNTKRNKFLACFNHFKWSDEEKWLEYDFPESWSEGYIDGWSSQIQKNDSQEGVSESYSIPIDNLNALGCKLFRYNDEDTADGWWIDKGDSESQVTTQYYFFPKTKLNTLSE